MSDEKPKAGAKNRDLHDMGGAIGPASIRGPEEPVGARPDDDAAPRSGYARP